MRIAPVVALWIALPALAGCYTTSIAQTPSTVPPGKLRGGFGMAAAGFTRSSEDGLQPELSLHGGVIDRLEIGFKTSFLSFEGQVKGQILRGDLDLSVALVGMIAGDPNAYAADDDTVTDEDPRPYSNQTLRGGRLMLIAGQRIVDSVDLVLMGDAQLGQRYGQDRGVAFDERVLGVGGGLGLLVKSEDAQFLPEVVVTHFLDGGVLNGDALKAHDTRIQFTFTVMIGAADDG